MDNFSDHQPLSNLSIRTAKAQKRACAFKRCFKIEKDDQFMQCVFQQKGQIYTYDHDSNSTCVQIIIELGTIPKKNLPYQKGHKAKKEINYLKMNHQPLNIKAISCLGVPPMGGGLFKS
jgi:hypothetical protein